MTVNAKMTAIADKIRGLTGGTSTLTLDTMASSLDGVNTDVGEQANLISQITTALEDKAAYKLQDKVVTPSVSKQTITPDSGYNGLDTVTVKGDANLIADNIKEGISIFGVNGTFAGSGGGGEASGTCNLTLYDIYGELYYINPDTFELVYTKITDSELSITIPVNSIVIILDTMYSNIFMNIEEIFDNTPNSCAFYVYGDGEIWS